MNYICLLISFLISGYGVAKGIPTLIIAVAGICDALSVAIFGIGKSIMFSDDSVTSQVLSGPISVIGGIGFGVIWGIICNYTPEKHDPFMVPLRILLLLVGGMISVFGSDLIGKFYTFNMIEKNIISIDMFISPCYVTGRKVNFSNGLSFSSGLTHFGQGLLV